MERSLEARPLRAIRRWWGGPGRITKLALVLAGVFAFASVVNFAAASLGRATANRASAQAIASTMPAASVPPLLGEVAPAAAGKTWSATTALKGSGSRESETFVVGEHWRVDWIFSPAQTGGILQVFIYRADGRQLMNLAANNAKGGADSSFWAGAGTYFLKINSSGGEWELAVQDLRNELDSAWVSQSPAPPISVGEQATLTFLFRNTGVVAWRRGTASEVSLGLTGDDRRFDARMTVDWPLPSRPATQTEDEVAPGALATFSFKVRGVAPGMYRIDLRPTMSNVGWLRDEGVYVEVMVR